MLIAKLTAGSHALRVANENSDRDSIEIVMPTFPQLVGLEPFNHNQQVIVGKKDVRIYSLLHFARQVISGNANFVQALWLPIEYRSLAWVADIEPYRHELFDHSAFAVSAVHVANALLTKGTGKAAASGVAMLLFASNVLYLRELPYSLTDYQIIKNFRNNDGWIDRKLVESLKQGIDQSGRFEFDRDKAVYRFVQAMKTAWE